VTAALAKLDPVDGWPVYRDEAAGFWLRDEDLGARVKLARPRNIRATIAKAIEEGALVDWRIHDGANNVPLFQEFAEDAISGKGRRQTVTVYYLNREGTVLILARLRTEGAEAALVTATIGAMRVFDAMERGALVPAAPALTEEGVRGIVVAALKGEVRTLIRAEVRAAVRASSRAMTKIVDQHAERRHYAALKHYDAELAVRLRAHEEPRDKALNALALVVDSVERHFKVLAAAAPAAAAPVAPAPSAPPAFKGQGILVGWRAIGAFSQKYGGPSLGTLKRYLDQELWDVPIYRTDAGIEVNAVALYAWIQRRHKRRPFSSRRTGKETWRA